MIRRILNAAAVFAAVIAFGQSAAAVTFTASYTDGGSWGDAPTTGLFAQGFSPFVHNPPDPGLTPPSTVYLTNFRFFKSGNPDSAANIRLAIVRNIYTNLAALTTTSTDLVSLSTNTVASTASLATGAPFDFHFTGAPVGYSDNTAGHYAAIFVNEGAGGVLTPVLVSTLRANYVETPPGSGTYLPQTNYGDPDPTLPLDDRLTCANFTHTNVSGTFFDPFFGYADANFVATFNTKLPGDFDGDKDVDVDDLNNKWKPGFGQTAVLDADSDGDGDVDGADFLTWQSNLGTVIPMMTTTSIPEPGALALMAFAALAVVRPRRQRTCRGAGGA